MKSEHLWLIFILIIGFLLRFAIWVNTSETGLRIVDEQHYSQLAENLVAGHGFAWDIGRPTSIRPPLYPAFIASVWLVTGNQDPQSIRFAQILLSMLSVYLLYLIGRRAFSAKIALIAAAIFCFYPTYVGFASLLYAEILFIFLMLLVTVGYLTMIKATRALLPLAIITGSCLGLAALTRTIAWPFFLVFVPLVILNVGYNLKSRIIASTAIILGFVLIIAPWSYRNTLVQHEFTLIDTMGGMNLMMGNYEYTPMNRAWDAIQLRNTEKGWSYLLRQSHSESRYWSEKQLSSRASQQAKEFMLAHPSLTLQRSVRKFFAFWGLERVIIAAWQKGLYQPSAWLVALGTLTITFVYVATMTLGVIGLFLALPSEQKFHFFVWTLLVVFTGVHALIFGHARYHIPLIPFLTLYAASAIQARSWKALFSRQIPAYFALFCIGLLLFIWTREIFFVEGPHISSLIQLIF